MIFFVFLSNPCGFMVEVNLKEDPEENQLHPEEDHKGLLHH